MTAVVLDYHGGAAEGREGRPAEGEQKKKSNRKRERKILSEVGGPMPSRPGDQRCYFRERQTRTNSKGTKGKVDKWDGGESTNCNPVPKNKTKKKGEIEKKTSHSIPIPASKGAGNSGRRAESG